MTKRGIEGTQSDPKTKRLRGDTVMEETVSNDSLWAQISRAFQHFFQRGFQILFGLQSRHTPLLLASKAKDLPLFDDLVLPSELNEDGPPFISSVLTDHAFASENGIAGFKIPNQENYVFAITDPSVIESVSKYGHYGSSSFDSELKSKVAWFEIFSNHQIFMNQNNEQVREVRTKLNKVLSNQEWIKKTVENVFFKWLAQSHGCKINLTESLKIAMFEMISKTIIGIDHLPSGSALKKLMTLIDEIDKVIMIGKRQDTELLIQQMKEFSHWIINKNQESIRSRSNIIEAIFPLEDLNEINLSVIFLATSNITKLVVQVLTYLASNPSQQLELKNAIENQSQVYLDGFFMESCRIFGNVPLTKRYFSNQYTVRSSKNGQEYIIPAGSTVFIPHRRIHFHEPNFTHPNEFRPLRPEYTRVENPVKLNSPTLIPFGLGQRMCPASKSFTRFLFNIWIELWTKHCEVINDLGSPPLEIPSGKINYIEFELYMVTIKQINAVAALPSAAQRFAAPCFGNQSRNHSPLSGSKSKKAHESIHPLKNVKPSKKVALS